MSPSTRRAWIEIYGLYRVDNLINVALHPEGVDRNLNVSQTVDTQEVALHPEGVDRNSKTN